MKDYKNLEKKTAQFLKELASLNAPPIYKMAIPDARKVLDDLQAKHVTKPAAKVEDLTVPGAKSGKISIRIVRPQASSGHLPVIMYFHGGGWILGNKHTHERLIHELACGANAALVFVNYTPAPEGKFPKQIDEAFEATKYIAEHGSEMNLDVSRLAVAGDSVGGNMAAVVALLAKERGGPKINFQLLIYPVTDANFHTMSYKEFADGPWLTRAAMEWFWNAYEPNLETRKKPTVSPLQASLKDLEHLPPALVITDENDVLRDEGEAYAHKLLQAGNEVTAVRFLGTIHDFLLLNPLCETPAAKSALMLCMSSLHKALWHEQKSRH